MLLPGPQPPNVPVLIAVFLGLLAAESFSVQFEFRKQSFSWSPSELAFVMALVAVGGAWTAVARAAAVGDRRWPCRAIPRPKAAFNVGVVVLEVCAAVGVLRLLPPGDISEPPTWLVYLLAVARRQLPGRAADRRRHLRHAGLPRPRRSGRRCSSRCCSSARSSVLVGLAVLLLVSVTAWAWLLITPLLVALALLYRRFGAVTREGHSVERVYDFARRVEQVPPTEVGTLQIVQAVRELLNAERVALWLPPYLDEEPRLVVDAENGAVWYDGPGDPDDVFRRRAVARRRRPDPGLAGDRADDEEAAALARRGVSDLLGAPIMHRGRRARATSRSATGAATSSPSPTATAPRWTRCSPTSTPRSGSSSCSPRSATTPTTTGSPGCPTGSGWRPRSTQLLAADPVGARAGLILAALGNYTEVTDTLGHAASDELLLVTAGLLREHAPPQALLARMEGEQFAVLLPGLSLAATERAARRLREAASTRARVAGLDLEVTLTIGVAAAPVHGTDAGMLMQRADVALLAAARLRRRRQLPPGPRPAEPAPAAAGHRARAGDGRRPDQRRLPADHRRADLRHRLGGDARPLGAPALRVDPAGRLHPPRRADRPDRRRSPTTCSTWRWPAAGAGWTRTSRCRSR